MPEMRETHRILHRFGKGLDWFSAADPKRKSRSHLHGMHSEEMSHPIAKIKHSQLAFASPRNYQWRKHYTSKFHK
jgi:hypothetical protein